MEYRGALTLPIGPDGAIEAASFVQECPAWPSLVRLPAMMNQADPSRTEQFVSLFNELERFLRDTTGAARNVPFVGLVESASKRNAAIRHYGPEMREWSDLRNAIVHEHPKGRVIAEVTPEALEEFQQIVAKVTAPPLVMPTFQRDVRVFKESDPLVEAVEDLWREGYSQVIVRRNQVLTLLSYTGITRWMGDNVRGTTIDLNGSTVGSALPFEEEGGIGFLARTATIYDARELFQSFPANHKKQRLRVIVITEHGNASETPLGLITASDVVEAKT
jgi:hypothetical protein